jgi:hypothetical protein
VDVGEAVGLSGCVKSGIGVGSFGNGDAGSCFGV